MEAIDTKAIKDAVAEKHKYKDWNDVLVLFNMDSISFTELKRLENEVISQVAKQVAEATKQSCAENARLKVKLSYINDLGFDEEVYEVNKESILNAPIPEII